MSNKLFRETLWNEIKELKDQYGKIQNHIDKLEYEKRQLIRQAQLKAEILEKEENKALEEFYKKHEI